MHLTRLLYLVLRIYSKNPKALNKLSESLKIIKNLV